MSKRPVVSILGCGWFGLPMARHLVSVGFTVKGSTTSPAKLPLLTGAGIGAFLVQLGSTLTITDPGFFNCDILIVCIPPKGDYPGYVKKMELVADAARRANVSRLIYISATSVYGDVNRLVVETDPPMPASDSGKAMVAAEAVFASAGARTAIIRFAGLVGPGRHPGTFLAGKNGLANAAAPVNLVHLADCIGAVSAVIEQDTFGFTFNVCSPDHPTRQQFYTQAAAAINLPEPHFSEGPVSWKLVGSVHIPAVLRYAYQVADWAQWLAGGIVPIDQADR